MEFRIARCGLRGAVNNLAFIVRVDDWVMGLRANEKEKPVRFMSE